jgi:hypothetical protein
MTAEEIRRLRDLLEKATPGPWFDKAGVAHISHEEDRREHLAPAPRKGRSRRGKQ